MLSCLRIQNFALIDRLELTFSQGLNVLTGETGAGKSIILDAIDLVLGGKIHGRAIRQGTQSASIEATFTISPITQAWLQAQEIEPLEDNVLICSRELTLTGESLRSQGGAVRSRSRVNGVLINRQLLSQLREYLVEITAQGQTTQLMESAVQRGLLDLYGGKSILEQRQRVESAYSTYQTAQKKLEDRRESEKNRLQRLDLLEYQLKEFEEAQLTDADEAEALNQERDRLSHVVELQQLSYQAYQLLYQNDLGESAIADLLGTAEGLLTDMSQYDEAIASILEMVRGALTQIVEASQQLSTYGDSLESDPQRLNEVEERIVLLKRLCRKYGPTLKDAIAYEQKLAQELAELTDQDQSVEKLEQEYEQTKEVLIKECETLTQLRQQTAYQLEKQLVKELKPLAMEKVIFVCQITPTTPNGTGADQVVFYFSPNPGEKIQPLSTTASGGEMSRFLLALKACFSQADNPDHTLIFDEIDVGVSGKVAQAIADKLYQLGQTQQVLCVTHQPLVAAMADSHFRVDKNIIQESSLHLVKNSSDLNLSEIRTVVRVIPLTSVQARQRELAQLTGGHSAEEALTFAQSLLTKANKQRSQTS
ncbi:MAG: DNA repair protein RecN [Snowella sp.]|nr:DNA repair protein RecN [Snowella sp.]